MTSASRRPAGRELTPGVVFTRPPDRKRQSFVHRTGLAHTEGVQPQPSCVPFFLRIHALGCGKSERATGRAKETDPNKHTTKTSDGTCMVEVGKWRHLGLYNKDMWFLIKRGFLKWLVSYCRPANQLKRGSPFQQCLIVLISDRVLPLPTQAG